MAMARTKMGKVLRTCGEIRGGTLYGHHISICSMPSHLRFGAGERWEKVVVVIRKTYGGNARFGRRSMRISPSLGGGIRFSGDHTLVGVFQGTTGFVGSGFEGAVDAWRNVGRRRKHWRFG